MMTIVAIYRMAIVACIITHPTHIIITLSFSIKHQTRQNSMDGGKWENQVNVIKITNIAIPGNHKYSHSIAFPLGKVETSEPR